MFRAIKTGGQYSSSHHLVIVLLFLFSFTSQSLAQESAPASPKPGWGEFEVVEEKVERSIWLEIALWPVNRFLDLIDIFRVDVGVGGATGGVVRITEYGQAGYRSISPGSVRVGGFGRDWPAMLETSSEFGIGPTFVQSKDREVCTGEIGVGADLFIGAYLGLCVEEVADFVTGLFFLDIMDDDLHPE